MKVVAPRLLTLALGLGLYVGGAVAWSPPAAAQFFWSPFFGGGQPAQRPKARPKPRAPRDELPPIVPKQSTAPPPPDDRPYDNKLLRLAEILGAVHYLRELCGAQEGQLWRNQMKELLRYEGSTAVRRAKLVNSFNDGYRGYRRTYRSCTSSATLAVTRFLAEASQITDGLAKPTYASAPAAEDPQQGEAAASLEGAEGEKPAENKPPENKPADGKPNDSKTEANAAPEAKPAEAGAGEQAAAPKPEAKPAEGQAAAASAEPAAGETPEAAEPPVKPRRKRRAKRAPPPSTGWFPMINR